MSRIFVAILLTVFCLSAHAQANNTNNAGSYSSATGSMVEASTWGKIKDSLRQILSKATHDSIRIQACWDLYNAYEETNRDSARYFMEEGLRLSRKNGKKLAEARCLISNAYLQLSTGLYVESLENLLQAQSIIESHGNEQDNWLSAWSNAPGNAGLVAMAYAHHTFANLMTPTLNTEEQMLHYREAMRLGREAGNTQRVLLANLGLGRTYLDNNRIDSALVFEMDAARIAEEQTLTRFIPAIQSYLGALYLKKNQTDLALQHLHQGVRTGIQYGIRSGLAQNYYRLAKYYLDQANRDSALHYALQFKEVMETVGAVSLSTVDKGTAYEYLYLAYQLNQRDDSAYYYQGLALATKDSINNARMNSLAAFQHLALREQLRLRDIEKEQALYESRVRSYGLLAGLAVFSIIALILYRNNKQKQQANTILQDTLSDLKATQTQLIHAEKMASLGELTAGIAHEIRNPLNFVNNFSDLNRELIDELQDELKKGDVREASAIAENLKDNEVKINLHGRRADGIVKSMLQHSRSSSGQKEPTDVNQLVDEYVRLAYHGYRAQQKDFNVRLDIQTDPNVGKVNMVAQDIGRVLLNLLNNAFQAVEEKAKSAGPDFQPTVTISTRLLTNESDNPASRMRPAQAGQADGSAGFRFAQSANPQSANAIIVCVADNGPGIPDSIKDKIFQPFFTTKPTGQGTGLGLSLSYDIVTKGHSGELIADTTKETGTCFTIRLPLQ